MSTRKTELAAALEWFSAEQLFLINQTDQMMKQESFPDDLKPHMIMLKESLIQAWGNNHKDRQTMEALIERVTSDGVRNQKTRFITHRSSHHKPATRFYLIKNIITGMCRIHKVTSNQLLPVEEEIQTIGHSLLERVAFLDQTMIQSALELDGLNNNLEETWIDLSL